eukprot:gnl/MRDRNA2_/MRDRNA2_127893_c0_seq1.p1 gnl/MRDRNA2_/MRDRNA2_127893_c0~~gnl/MRDRNA2_/MRDRNA2_127893_c0_seq1.p1  ORF type:complete len:239 (-),score=49.17 gnl/MRDRNA2_/MRDRNA2_127893_c0_seq1:6-662(-)
MVSFGGTPRAFQLTARKEGGGATPRQHQRRPHSARASTDRSSKPPWAPAVCAVNKAPPGEPSGFIRVPREVQFRHGETLRKELRKSWEPVYQKGLDETGQPCLFRTRLGDDRFNYLSHEQAALVQKAPGAASGGTKGNDGRIMNSPCVGTWVVDPAGEDNKPRHVYSEGGVFYVILNVNTKRFLSKDEADNIVFADSIDRHGRPRNLESFAKTFADEL